MCWKDHMVHHSFQMEEVNKEGAGQHWVTGNTHTQLSLNLSGRFNYITMKPAMRTMWSPSSQAVRHHFSDTKKHYTVTNFQLFIILSQLSLKIITHTGSYQLKMIHFGTFAHVDILSIWSFYPIPSAHSGPDAKRWNSHFSSVNALWSCGETAHRHQSFRQLLGSSASLWLSFCCFLKSKAKISKLCQLLFF